VPVGERQVGIARWLAIVIGGNLLGSAFAGAVGDLFGWRAVFTAMSVLGFIILVVAIFGFRGLGGKGGGFDLSQTLPNYRAIFRNPLARFCFITVVIEAMFMYGLFPHLASLLEGVGDARASIAGIVIAGFGAGGAIYSVRVAWLLNRFGERWMMRLGGIIMGLCIAFVALRAPWPAQVADFVVLGLGFYMLHAVVQIYASELAPAARGSAMALHSFFFFTGQAFGPVFYKYGFAHIGVAPVLLFAGVMLALTGLMCGHYLRRGSPV
jgi:predicted MFS family arabinose efflux permease